SHFPFLKYSVTESFSFRVSAEAIPTFLSWLGRSCLAAPASDAHAPLGVALERRENGIYRVTIEGSEQVAGCRTLCAIVREQRQACSGASAAGHRGRQIAAADRLQAPRRRRPSRGKAIGSGRFLWRQRPFATCRGGDLGLWIAFQRVSLGDDPWRGERQRCLQRRYQQLPVARRRAGQEL